MYFIFGHVPQKSELSPDYCLVVDKYRSGYKTSIDLEGCVEGCLQLMTLKCGSSVYTVGLVLIA